MTSEIASLATSPVVVELMVAGDAAQSTPFELELAVSAELPISLSQVPSGAVNWNDLTILTGTGFLEEGEGQVTALVEGTFVVGGQPVPVSVQLPVQQAEDGSRDRGLIQLSTDIGSIQPGSFSGTLQLRSELTTRTFTESEALPLMLEFGLPVVFDVTPTMGTLEQILSVPWRRLRRRGAERGYGGKTGRNIHSHRWEPDALWSGRRSV